MRNHFHLRFEANVRALLSGFGVGFVGRAPGTLGSLMPLAVLALPLGLRQEALFAIIIFFTVVTIAGIEFLQSRGNSREPSSTLDRDLKDGDPSWVISDEIVGMSLVLLPGFVHSNVAWALTSFVIFRFFDIVKPFPIHLIDQKQGSFFVLLDDVVASIYSVTVVVSLWFLQGIIGLVLFSQNQ